MILIYKSGDQSLASNCRQISLTSIIGKLMESITADNIQSHLQKCNLIYESWHGFTKRCSCLANLLAFSIFLLKYLRHQTKIKYMVMCLWISVRHLIRVPHTRILKKAAVHRIGEISWNETLVDRKGTEPLPVVLNRVSTAPKVVHNIHK